MTAANTNIHPPVAGFEANFDTCVEEAAFLWLLRSIAVDQPHCVPDDIAELERRIEAQLMALMISPESGWQACVRGLAIAGPGEVFVAAVVAVRSLDIDKIQTAVEAGLAEPAGFKALVSALGWLPGRYVHPWIKRFFTSKDLAHKQLAVAACRVRREDPCNYLTRILERDDCQSDEPLLAECLRTAGVFKRQDLRPVLESISRDGAGSPHFWALWAASLLGDRSSPYGLKDYACEPGAYQLKALRLAVRTLPPTEAKAWISHILREHNQYREAIQATAALGDPEAMPWVISCMRESALARVAGEAFNQMTGVDLEAHELHHRLPEIENTSPNDDPEDERVDMDEDEYLPWPNSEKIAALWSTIRSRFQRQQRYLLGRLIAPEHLHSIVAQGGQRQRAAAALEWAILEPKRPLPNISARQEVSQ